RALASRRQPEEPADARAVTLVAPREETAPLELVQQLVHLPDVRMPERTEPLLELLQELVSVRLAVADQRQERVPQVHASASSPRPYGAGRASPKPRRDGAAADAV